MWLKARENSDFPENLHVCPKINDSNVRQNRERKLCRIRSYQMKTIIFFQVCMKTKRKMDFQE